MMGYGGFGSMGAFDGLGMVFGLLLLVALVALIALFVWAVGTRFSPQSRAAEATPLEIVQRRYVRGQMTETEYEQARKALA